MSQQNSHIPLKGKKIEFSLSKATPTSPILFHLSPTTSSSLKKNQSKLVDSSQKKTLSKGQQPPGKKRWSFLTPGVAPQRRRSDQDGTPTTSSGNGSHSKHGGGGKKNSIRPLRASPLFMESPYFGSSQFSASKACQALIHSPCRSENYRRQRRRLYHQDEYEDVKRKLSLPDSAGGVFRTPKLGNGGFGSVYIGKYGGKKVAIKQLHSKGQSGKSGQGESLCAELNAFRLHHANIVQILTFSCSGPRIQIVFEYVGRRNLQQLLDEPGEQFQTNQRLKYCLQIADALQFCHTNRVLHLDVKPANILLTDDLTTCKLADFGCSRIINSSKNTAESTSTTTTRTMSACYSASTPGTLMYKAPELLRGSIASPKADVYSFGYVLWQCATKQLPFEGMNMHTVVFCVVARGLRPSVKQELIGKLTGEEKLLIELSQNCWKAGPETRPDLGDVQKVLNDFAFPDFLEGEK